MHVEYTECNGRAVVGLGLQWPDTFCQGDKPRMVSVLGPDDSGTITTSVRSLRTECLGIGSGLKGTVTDICKKWVNQKKEARRRQRERKETHKYIFRCRTFLQPSFDDRSTRRHAVKFVEQQVNTGIRNEKKKKERNRVTHNMAGYVSEAT